MLKAVVEKIEDVAEPYRDLYAEDDGKFVLKVEPVGGYSLEDIGGLKNTLGKEMTTRKNLEKTLAKFKDIDPDRAREAFLRLEEFEKMDPSKDADKIIAQRVEAAKNQLLQRHTQEVGERDSKIGRLTKTVENLLIDQVATAALAETKGAVNLLLPHIQKQTRVREVDDQFVVEVIDPRDGTVRIGNAKGEPMTIQGLVQEMAKSPEFARAFEGSGNSGGGTQPNKSGGGTPSVKRRSDLKTREDRVAFINSFPSYEEGTKAYNALPV